VKILLVSDLWLPHASGLVTALQELVAELQTAGHVVEVVHPGRFPAWAVRRVGWAGGAPVAWWPGPRLDSLLRRARPDAIHLATEGPLGWAARRYCLRHRLRFTTSFHTRYPEILQARWGVPPRLTLAVLRRFHAPSSGVMVPGRSVADLLTSQGFGRVREWTQGLDLRLFRFSPEPAPFEGLGPLAHPVSLYVGRLTAEKSVADFLELDVPGSKVVCGDGPLAAEWRERYPGVHWLGPLPRPQLAALYAAADVLVFPSRSETFGHVMLEALACGTPVAAYPVAGPLEVLGTSGAGALANHLQDAWHEALRVPRAVARERARQFGWRQAAELFVQHLAVPAREPFTRMSQKYSYSAE
jgi:glycosyltransferase involved in cell wall biosynthesis